MPAHELSYVMCVCVRCNNDSDDYIIDCNGAQWIRLAELTTTHCITHFQRQTGPKLRNGETQKLTSNVLLFGPLLVALFAWCCLSVYGSGAVSKTWLQWNSQHHHQFALTALLLERFMLLLLLATKALFPASEQTQAKRHRHNELIRWYSERLVVSITNWGAH